MENILDGFGDIPNATTDITKIESNHYQCKWCGAWDIRAITVPILHIWVTSLPLREQGTLLTGIRGCDVTPKEPLDSAARRLVAYLRWAVMHPADPREVDIEGAFFSSVSPGSFRPSELGHYPQHWYAHVMHCYEVVAYRHPVRGVRYDAGDIYARLVHSLHLNPETREQMIERLSEDRIATGTVVS